MQSIHRTFSKNLLTKNYTMKKLIFLGILSLALFACDKEDTNDEITGIEESQLDKEDLENLDGSKSINIGGVVYKSGYGYGYDSRNNLRPFRPAIDVFDTFSSNDLNANTEVSVEIVNNEKDVRDFIKKGDAIDFSVSYMGFSFGINHSSEISREMIFSSDYVNVIAKIKIPTQRWLADEDPFIDFRALDLLNQGQYSRFFGAYGPGFVSDVLYGGDVYYTHTYNASSLTEEEKKTLNLAINIGYQPYFSIGVTTSLTEEQKRVLKKSYTRTSVTSNVPGFNPGLITNWEDSEALIEAKQEELRQYLIANPDLVPVIKRTVIPWDPENMVDLQPFADEFNRQLEIYRSRNGS